eukprot:1159818-Pelagomonas_calceolata.AAC.5
MTAQMVRVLETVCVCALCVSLTINCIGLEEYLSASGSCAAASAGFKWHSSHAHPTQEFLLASIVSAGSSRVIICLLEDVSVGAKPKFLGD